jgi:hypothetical protein
MLKNYKRKEVWSRGGKDFLIEVVRWETITEEKLKEIQSKIPSYNEGRFVWNVYCYIYPKHPLFIKLDTEDMFNGRIENFHGGCTFSKWHRSADGEITAKQYGCDYNHYQDDRFTHIENPERAYVVFHDAEALFKELTGGEGEKV